MRSPCLECERRDADKNDPACKHCEGRLAYVAAIGDMSYGMPDDLGNWREGSLGGGGNDVGAAGEGLEMTDHEGTSSVDATIDRICGEEGVARKALFSVMRTRAVCRARMRLVAALRSEPHGMGILGTSAVLHMSPASVSTYTKKAKAEGLLAAVLDSRAGARRSQENDGRAGARRSRETAQQTGDPAAALDALSTDSALRDIFRGFQDDLEALTGLAARELRTPRDQLVYLVRAATREG